MASEPPEGISTVVSARRVLIDGMVCVVRSVALTDCVSVSALSLDSSDTSVSTLRLILPSDMTTGVKFRPTPNFLNWIWVWQFRVVGSQVKPEGIGNSPPARKFAVSPEIAVRFGSANVRITPARSIARSVAVTPR